MQTFASGEEVNEISIDNDFVGGNDKIAGADEVKNLNAQLYGVTSSTINLDDYELHNGLIVKPSGSDVWVYRTSDTTRNYKIINVEAGKNIKITANANYAAKFTFLKSYPETIVNNTTQADFCEGITGELSVTMNSSLERVIPSDCAYMYVLIKDGATTDRTPSSIEYLAESGDIQSIEARIGYYVCDSEGNVAAKIVSDAAGYVLSRGGSMKIKMTNANTADNVTLNINSTGAKTLYYKGEAASSANSWEAGETVEVYYDGTNFYANNVGGSDGVFYTGETVSEVSIVNIPTAGSNDLVKSGGVESFVADVNSIGKREISLDFYGFTTKAYYTINSEGYIVSSTDDRAKVTYTNAPVNKGAILQFAGNNSNRTAFVIGISSVPITDDNLGSVQITLLSYKTYTASSTMSEKIVVPFDGYIVFHRISTLWFNLVTNTSNVTAIKDNSVLDVSELNNTNYASLQDAIAAVPTSLQRGGMEIRFIQFIPATYTVVKTEGVTTQPAGTEVMEALNLEDGIYTADEMEGVEPPASGSVTYYLTVTDGNTTTYTTWVITKDSNDVQKYLQYRLMTADWSSNVKDWADYNGDASEKIEDALTDDVTVVEFNYTMTYWSEKSLINPPLPKDKKYTITVTVTGESNDKMRYLYLMSNSSSLTYPNIGFGVRALEDGPMTFEVTPTFDVVAIRLDSASSIWSGSVDVSIVVETKEDKYVSSSLIDEKIAAERINDIGVSINVFGDVLPEQFKTKLVETNDDLLIACQGDSVTGLTQKCNPSPDPAHDCPGGQYQSFVYLLQKNVGKTKPFYNRLDSQRNNADFFTKTGTWERTASYSDIQGIPSAYQEASVTCLTYRSNNVGASIAFSFDADSYEKCNIIFTRCVDGGDAVLNVQQGNGKLLASIDRVTWVEANGFSHSQQLESRPTNTAGAETFDKTGKALCQRHRRLWLKKADSTVTGTLNITYSKVGSDSSYVYCWGTEMYSGRGIFFDNIGRGGKSMNALKKSISDIFDRNPDLTILEMPLANDTNVGYAASNEELLGDKYYGGYFLNDIDGYSYKIRSENYTKYPIIVVLPHPRSQAFDENDNAILSPEGCLRTAPNYDLYKMVWAYLRTNLKNYDNVRFVNLCDQFLNEAKYRYGSWHDGLSANCMTDDGIHLNQRGADAYNKYLAPIFQC